MEITGVDESWINRKNKRHNRSIQNMVRASIIDSNNHENKLCCAAETSAYVHICRMKSDMDNIPPYSTWYGKKPSIHEVRTFGFDIYPIKSSPKKLHKKDHLWVTHTGEKQ